MPGGGMKMQEWRDVVGYEQLYQISNDGVLRSKDRVVNSSRGQRFVRGKIISYHVDRHGYLSACLQNGKSTKVRIHRLVAEAFLPNPEGLPIVHHIDHDKTNNTVSNLQWVTVGDNNSRFWSEGPGTNLTTKVDQYDLDGNYITTYKSASDAARSVGTSSSNILGACDGRHKTMKGYRWKRHDTI